MKNKPHFVFIVLLFLFSDSYANQNKDSLKVSPKKHYVGIGIPNIVGLIPTTYRLLGHNRNNGFFNFNIRHGYNLNKLNSIENYLSLDLRGNTQSNPNSFGIIHHFSGINYMLSYYRNFILKKTSALSFGLGMNTIYGRYKNPFLSETIFQFYPTICSKFSFLKLNKNTVLSIFSFTSFIPQKNRLLQENKHLEYKNLAIRNNLSFGDFNYLLTNFIGINYEINF